MYQKCPICKGKGVLKQDTCPVCLGERIINKKTGLPPSKYVAPIVWPFTQPWGTLVSPTIIYSTPGTGRPFTDPSFTVANPKFSTLTN